MMIKKLLKLLQIILPKVDTLYPKNMKEAGRDHLTLPKATYSQEKLEV